MLNAALLVVGRTVVQSLASMGMALLSEVFLKDVVNTALRKLVQKYPSETHTKLLQALEHAWGLPDNK